MGSFSYTCQLSGLPITSGVQCAIIPMIPRGNFYDNGEAHWRKYGTSNFCSNEGQNVFFNEIFYPIFGEYNDYGSIEEIIKDDNTKLMEKFFELSIEEIVEVLTDGRKDEYEKEGQFCDSVKILKKDNPRHMLLLKTSVTWLHKGVYERLAKAPQQNYFDRLDLGTDGLLTHLGFKFIKQTKKERYNLEYQKDGLSVFSDGTCIEISGKESVYDLPAFKKYCKKHNVEIDITEPNSKGAYAQLYDYVLPTKEKLRDFSGDINYRINSMILNHNRFGSYVESDAMDMLIKIQQKAIELGAKEKRSEEEEKGLALLTKSLGKLMKEKKAKDPATEISPLIFDMIKSEGNGFLRQNIIDWFNVKSFYFITGRYLYPIGTSPQCGEHKVTALFLNACQEAFAEEMKERIASGYEEDENED